MYGDIIAYSEFTCSIILLVFAVLQITYKNKNFINYNLAGLYVCVSYVVFSIWVFKSGVIVHAPWLLYTDIPAGYAIGPFVYFYIRTVLGFRIKSYKSFMPHFIPAIVVLAIIIINNISNYPVITGCIQNIHEYNRYFINPVIRGLDIISNFYLLFYFIPAVRDIYQLLILRQHKSIRELRLIFNYMMVVLLLAFIMLIGNAAGKSMITTVAIYLLTMAGIWYFIFSFRYPEFTQMAIKEARSIRYEGSLNSGINADVVLGRLDELMDDDKVYMDYNLTLNRLSELLMVTPHQLSRILNTNRNINFRTLVNKYRIKESINMMKDHPDKTILEIALESGFNSKSSFNSVFAKETGVAPRDYRRIMKN